MKTYMVTVDNQRPVRVKAPNRLEALAKVLNKRKLRYAEVRTRVRCPEEDREACQTT